MDQRSFKVYNKDRDPIRGDVSIPEPNKRFPVIIIVHGFKGFKDWGFFPHLARMICAKGFIVIKFNLSGSGIGEDLEQFTELEKFATNTYSKELADVSTVLDELEKGRICDKQGYFDRIGLLGHSRGGGISILTAAEDARIQALVTLSSVSHLDRKDIIDQALSWRRSGYIVIANKRTGQMMKIRTDLLDDIEAHKEGKLNIQQALSQIKIPYMIVHGEKDESVHVHEARHIYDLLSKKNSNLQIISETGHTFGVTHPFKGPTPEFKEAAKAAIQWFKLHLKQPFKI